MIYASIQDGSITIFARDAEGVSNYRTVEELAESLDPDVFWRPHRSYLVNINHIKEVVPWFKSSYMLKMNDKRPVRNPRFPRPDQAPARTLSCSYVCSRRLPCSGPRECVRGDAPFAIVGLLTCATALARPGICADEMSISRPAHSGIRSRHAVIHEHTVPEGPEFMEPGIRNQLNAKASDETTSQPENGPPA